MKVSSRTRAANQGFTLIELAITMGIAGLVLGSLARVLDSSKNTYGRGSAVAQVQNDARRTLDRVSAELENGGFGTLLPNPVGVAVDDLVFQAATGIDGATGALLFGNSSRLRFVYETGEMNNGLDDDSDGLVDEGCLVFTRNYLLAGEVRVILAHGVAELLEGETANGADDNGNGFADEPGFCITRTGNLLQVRLTLIRPVTGGDPAMASVETALRLKN